jgi:hypothetical protein
MKTLLTASAAIELVAGLALLCCPSAMASLLIGATLEGPAAVTVARIAGAGLFALGLACWMVRKDSPGRAARGLIVAMLFYDIAATVILAFAGIGLGLHGMALWPAVVIHSVMTAWCIASLCSSE